MGQPRSHRFINLPGLFTDEQVDGWRAVTEAVHAEGGTIFANSHIPAPVSHPHFFEGTPPLAPSAVNPGLRAFTQEGFKETATPRAMTIADIKGTIGDYATAAQNARAAGFNGVEVHAGTTYLLPEFLNSALNGAVTFAVRRAQAVYALRIFKAAATASRHVVIDAARSTRCD